MAWVWFPFFWNVEHFYVTLVPSETSLIRTWGWKWQVNMKNINAYLKVGEKLKEHHIVKSASMFITSLCLWKRVLLLFEWNFSWGSLLSKLMWHGFSHFPEIVTWGLFLHTAYEAKCKKKLRQRWFFHRTLMYTEKEIVEKGLGKGKILHSHNWPLAN